MSKPEIGNNPEKSKKRRSSVGLFLFGLPFLAAGLFPAYLALSSLYRWSEARSWVEVPAIIVSANLEMSSDSDSTTYRAEASYRYTHLDRTFTGTRVSLYSGSDNIGSFHEDIHRQLLSYVNTGKPFRCFVDPNHPEESILFRDLRFGLLSFYLLFFLLFGGAGSGLMIYSMVAGSRAKLEGELRALHPGKPWLTRPDWKAGNVNSNSAKTLVFSVAFALFWNLVSSPILFLIPNEVREKDNLLALLGLVFPAVGAGLVIWAARNLLRARKYGSSTFEMSSVPGVIGGKLGGIVHTSTEIYATDGYTVALRCIQKVTRRSGSRRSTTQTILWEDKKHFDRELLQGKSDQSAIPILFAIPYDSRPTTMERGSDQVIWRLQVKAAVPGIDFETEFDVPVFKTPESSPEFVLDDSPIRPFVAPPQAPRLTEDAGILVRPLPSRGIRVEFPRGRNKGSALAFSFFVLVWTGFSVGMMMAGPRFFAIWFCLFNLLFLWLALRQWLWRSEIRADPEAVKIESGLFSLKSLHVPTTQIESVYHTRGMQSGQTLFYRLAMKRSGKEVILGQGIPDLTVARYLVTQLNQALGVHP